MNLNKLSLDFSSIWFSVLMFLPDEFSKYRVKFYNNKGCKISVNSTISPNVRIRGLFEMKEGSSIAQNCSISKKTLEYLLGKML